MTDYLQHHNDFNTPEAASSFDETSFWCSRFGALLFQHLELRQGLSILDLGCGTGFPLFELANTHGPSCQVTGVDVWAEALERARAKLRIQALPNVRIVEADGAAMPFPDAQFDLITCNLGLNNFADPAAVVAECFRVAKPGGRVVFTTNIRGHMAEFYALFREALLEMGHAEYLERLERHEAHRGTPASLGALLEQAGFIVSRAIEEQFQLRYLDGAAFFHHRFVKTGFLDGWRGVVNAEDEAEVFARLEARLNARAARDGELRMTVPMLYLEGQKPERDT
ncbi:MAG TPA: methyltransferase domain-containing protein [Ktedonobacterales bacterium]|jgi:ubiquinone/menaquinone biosynthesis C-methylase UbiE